MGLLVIGDCHGKWQSYKTILQAALECGHTTLQLGDLGFSDTYRRINQFAHTKYNFWFPGNHDQPPYNCKGYLGRFGWTTIGGVRFFFVSGGFSIDKKYRTHGLDWWPHEEELSGKEWEDCFKLYQQIKPEILIAHEAPRDIAQLIGNPQILHDFGYDPDWSSYTAYGLQHLIDYHKPKQFLCGHFHMSKNFLYKESIEVTVLNELETKLVSTS